MKKCNLFISYSHKDEGYLEKFRAHLSSLKHKGILDSWCDRELVAGDQLDKELRDHLGSADLVAFLISADFLSSISCYVDELEATLKRIDNDSVRVIPVIIRTCDWQETAIGAYAAATKDGKPINEYRNKDEGWLEVITSIEKATKELVSLKSSGDGEEVSCAALNLELQPDFKSKLDDTEVVFHHPHKEQITLTDIFVSPDLKNTKKEYDELEKLIPAIDITNKSNSNERVLILGSEQSGKTTLAKVFFESVREQGCVPLLCGGEQISGTDVDRLIGGLLRVQYESLTKSEYLDQIGKRVFIIDDYQKLKLNNRYQSEFLERIARVSDKIIVLSDTGIKYDDSSFMEFADYSQYEILPFGNARRGELIDKWNSIGRQQTIEIQELYGLNDRMTMHVNSIIRKNILPRKPLYVMTIIQLLSTTTPSTYALTSYGHCYQSLILASLKKANIDTSSFDLYINYLTEMAYWIFLSKADEIDEPEFEQFKKAYSKKFLISSHEVVIRKLTEAGILRQVGGYIGFSYRYIFYFYVAKYLADTLHVGECKKVIENLCINLHTQKNANILIFLVHHSKDKAIIDEILFRAYAVFDGRKEATLDEGDTVYLLDYIASIPGLVIEQRDIQNERKKRLEKQDKIEELTTDTDSESDRNSEDKLERNEDGGQDFSDALADINRSARVVEIIGQILRNRYGSLDKAQLVELSKSAYSCGFKFLDFFLTETRENQEELLRFIQKVFRENTNHTEESIIKEARRFFLMLCYGASYSVVKKIADSIGYDELIPVFEEINAGANVTPVMKLVYLAIKLEFTKEIPKKELESVYLEFSGNPIAQRLLQELVIQHLYMNEVEYRDRQWISSKLKLPVRTQRLLQATQEKKG